MSKLHFFATGLMFLSALPSNSFAHCGMQHDIQAPPSHIHFANALDGEPIGEEVTPPRSAHEDEFTLADLEAIALERNPSLAEARARVDAVEGRWVQVGLIPNPVIGYDSSDMGPTTPFGQQGGFISQRFITANKLGLNRHVASQEIEQLEQQWCAQRLRILNDVRIAFSDALLAQRRVEILEELLKLSQGARLLADQLFKATEGSRVDVLQALVEADTVRIEVDNAHNDRVTSWRKLAAVVGIPDMQQKNLVGNYSETPPTLTWENVLQELLAESPEIAASMANLERTRWQLSRAHAGRIPDVDVEGNVKYDNAARETLVGVRVGVPLMLFNRNQGNIQRAHAEVTAAARALERLELDLQRRLAIVFNRYEKARQQVERYAQNILPNAREAQQLVQNGYQDGEFDYLAVLTAQRTYVRANLAYLDALRQAQENRVAIQGQLLTGSLQIRP